MELYAAGGYVPAPGAQYPDTWFGDNLQTVARMIKLDPGPVESVNGVRYDRQRIVAACRDLAPVVVQAMVTAGPGWDGSDDAALTEWLPLLVAAAPAGVHLYSLDREPADPGLREVPRERLERMAATIRAALPRCDVQVFG